MISHVIGTYRFGATHLNVLALPGGNVSLAFGSKSWQEIPRPSEAHILVVVVSTISDGIADVQEKSGQ